MQIEKWGLALPRITNNNIENLVTANYFSCFFYLEGKPTLQLSKYFYALFVHVFGKI
jgi:hypothetical protein